MPRRGDKRASAAAASDAATPVKRTRAASAVAQAEAAAAAVAARAAARADERHQHLILARAPAAQLAPQDSLSSVLAFLNCEDFAAAAQACRQWRAASLRATSWVYKPTTGLPFWPCYGAVRGFAAPLNGGRAVRVPLIAQANTCVPSQQLEALLQQPAAAFLRALILHTQSGINTLSQNQMRTLARRTLEQLTLFPRLEAVHVNDALPFTVDEMTACFRTVGPRLVELSLHKHTAFMLGSPLSALVNLRVLSVVSNVVDADSLLQLRSLEHLTITAQFGSDMRSILRAARSLSVRGSLRAFELRSLQHFAAITVDLSELFAPLEEHPTLAPAALRCLMLHSSAVHDASHIAGLLLLPKLTAARLDFSGSVSLAWLAGAVAAQTLPVEPSCVTDLQLLLVDEGDIDESSAKITALAARLARVQNLRTNVSSSVGCWLHFVAHLHQLRQLTVGWRGQLSYEAAVALSCLPLFHTLIISAHPDDAHSDAAEVAITPVRIETPALRLIAKSSTWRTLVLRGGVRLRTQPLLEPLESSLLFAVSHFRIIVEPHAGRQIYQGQPPPSHHTVYQLQQVARAPRGVVAWQRVV